MSNLFYFSYSGIRILILCYRTGSSAYSDIQGQKAACCSLKEFRKAIHTVSAALALDAPEKSTKKSPLKRTASSSASSSKQNVSTTKTPNVTVVRTLEGLCKRYGVEAACLGTGLDYGVFLDDVARVENLLKEQGWGETLWDPVRGNVVTCVVFKWVCRELEVCWCLLLPNHHHTKLLNFRVYS